MLPYTSNPYFSRPILTFWVQEFSIEIPDKEADAILSSKCSGNC